MAMAFSLRQYLLFGFGLVLMFFTGSSIYVIYEVQKIHVIEEDLISNRFPAVLAAEKLLDGIDLSLAGLRAYMILGAEPDKAEKFKAERAAGWEKIDNVLASYEELSSIWVDTKNLERLSTIKTLIEEFRIAQQEIENIAHAPENIESLNILLTEAAPKATKISSAITEIINIEATLSATPERKALLKLLADSRGSFALGLVSIRAYLLSGDDSFRQDFNKKWAINEKRFQQISQQTYLLSSAQTTAWNTYSKNRTDFAPLPNRMFDLRSQSDWNKANHWLGTKAAPRAGKIKVLLAELATSINQYADDDVAHLNSEQLKLEIISAVVTIISIIIGITIALYLSHSVSTQLKAMVSGAKKMAKGDLTAEPLTGSHIKDMNTLAHTLNTTKDNLNILVSRILSSSNGLHKHSSKLQTLINDSRATTIQQEKETEQIATAMNEMGATVSEVAKNTTEAANAAEEADKAALLGHDVVIETVDNITDLAQGIEHAANTINQLGEETNAVDTILVAISGIADQTNLLALNAAIEAARAGEQGRGFAVVADEVRTLAARTQESTVEIRAMLDRLKTGATNAVSVMNEGHEQAQKSVDKANTAKETIQSITDTVNVIKDMNTQIATAAEEQSMVAVEMGRNITNVSTSAQDISTHSNKSLLSANEMAGLASQLMEGVSQFTIDSNASNNTLKHSE
jgi:methyl-accepting chemotaxis protein